MGLWTNNPTNFTSAFEARVQEPNQDLLMGRTRLVKIDISIESLASFQFNKQEITQQNYDANNEMAISAELVSNLVEVANSELQPKWDETSIRDKVRAAYEPKVEASSPKNQQVFDGEQPLEDSLVSPRDWPAGSNGSEFTEAA